MTDDSPTPRRSTVSRRLRFEILRRDGHTCRYCGASAPDVPLTVDHVIPIALGGGNEPANLVTACDECNSGKSSMAPDSALVDDVDASAALFAGALEKAAEVQRARVQEMDATVAEFDRLWCAWKCGDGEEVPRTRGWHTSVERFISLGLTAEDIGALIRTSMQSQAPTYATWRYFCKCCWNTINERAELARTLIEDGLV